MMQTLHERVFLIHSEVYSVESLGGLLVILLMYITLHLQKYTRKAGTLSLLLVCVKSAPAAGREGRERDARGVKRGRGGAQDS